MNIESSGTNQHVLLVEPQMSKLSTLLDDVLRIDPAGNVIEFRQQWYTWGQLAHSIDSIRSCLQQLGLSYGARIGVFVRNRPDALAAILTAIREDACMVSLNPLLPDALLLADLGTLQLPVVVGERGDFDRDGVLEAIRETGAAIIELAPILAGANLRAGFECITGDNTRREEPDVIIEMLTSGTTGTPKRVPLKRHAFETSFVSALSYERGRSADEAPRLRSGTQLTTNPMTHIGGLWGVLTTILGGRKTCIVEKFSVEAWRDAVVRHRPKVAAAVPSGLRMILDAGIPKEDLASLVALRTGAAPLPPAIVKEFWERYRLPVLQNYGATEFSGAVAGWTLHDFKTFHDSKIGSVGRFQPNVVGRVVDAKTGAELLAGNEGILEMKAKQFGIGDEWLRTTDRAVIDAEGFLFIRGRADNAIIRGGFKVHPDDVAAVIELHPAVREAVVVGISHARLGAVPVAAIMLKSGAPPPAAAELAAFVKERMLPYQVPTRFLFVDDVPRTQSMKPALPQVRALFEPEEAHG
jgi:long-chain acyl-CoA synthetase